MDPTYQGRVPRVPYSNRPRGRFQLNPRMLIIGGILLVCLIVGGILLANSGDKSGPLQQHLMARLATLQKMAEDGNTNLVDNDLRDFNSRLNIQLSSDINSIGDVTTQKKSDKTITANEADTASFDTLKDAKLNSRYDSTYRKIVAEKLDTTTLLMRELYGKTTSKKLKAALDASFTNLKKLEDQLTTNS